ncbi:MAG: hypothetical protein ACFFDG_13055 [Promethearchaeota archaeon]
MSKEEREKFNDKVHKLVIFKTKEDYQSEVIDRYTFEKIDQEDKIKLITELQPYGAHYRYSFIITNQSLAPISEVKIKIGYSNFLTLYRSYPPTLYIPEPIEDKNVSKITIEFDELNEKSTRQISLHFSPLSLGLNGEIRTIVTYVNSKDFVRVINSEPSKLFLDKITINPKIIPSSYIREFSQIPGMKRAIKSMGVGISGKVDPDLYFNLLEHIFLKNNLQLIAKDPKKKILWCFGSELESRTDVLLIGQVTSGKVEIIASSKNQYALISFLTLFSDEFKEQILVHDIITSLDQIHDLECKSCGAILPYFPKKGKEIKCNSCNYSQLIW